METTHNTDLLPTVLLLGKNIGDTLNLAKSLYLKLYTEKNEKLHGLLCQKVSDLKLEAPFVSEEYALDTNYYHCNVRLACFSYSSFVPVLDSEDVKKALQSHGVSSIEGLIFVSDLKGNKREGVDHYLKYNKEIVEKLNPEFMMCFANTEAEEGEDLFSIFNFEENEVFVEIVNDDLDQVNPTKPDPTIQKPKFEEKYGVDRVIENFECHMWPNMVRKDPQKKKAEQSAPVIISKEVVGGKEEKKENSKPETVDMERIKSNSHGDSEKGEIKEENKKKVESNNGQEADKKDENSAVKAAEAKVLGDTVKDPFEFEDEEDDKEMQDFASVLETVMKFKQGAKNLTDEERREKAAELIMKLVSNCKDLQGGVEGDDDDDDEDA